MKRCGCVVAMSILAMASSPSGERSSISRGWFRSEPDVHAHLRAYLALPGRVDRDDEPLFQSRLHKQVPRQVVEKRFRILCNLAGVRREESSPYQPRIHDLRHTFAVHRLTEWYRKGDDAQALLPALSTYLGHVELHSTQRYLTMTPELLGEANRRFERYVCGGGDE